MFTTRQEVLDIKKNLYPCKKRYGCVQICRYLQLSYLEITIWFWIQISSYIFDFLLWMEIATTKPILWLTFTSTQIGLIITSTKMNECLYTFGIKEPWKKIREMPTFSYYILKKAKLDAERVMGRRPTFSSNQFNSLWNTVSCGAMIYLGGGTFRGYIPQ